MGQRFLQTLPVAFYRYMDAVLHQLPEKVPLHVRFHDVACKIDGQRIFKADDGAVGAGGKGLSHIYIGNLQRTHICKPGRRIFILNPGIELPDHEILYEKRHHPDEGIALGAGIGSDISPQKFFINIITHVIMNLLHNLFKRIFTQSWIDGRIHHGDEIPQRLGREKTAPIHSAAF